MVYRGKPSAGCDNCRKAKKRCTLEQPACLRCVKLKKDCSGYRDTTQLQIQDESEAVRRKAIKQKARPVPAAPVLFVPDLALLSESDAQLCSPALTPAPSNSDSSSSGDSSLDVYTDRDGDDDEAKEFGNLGRSMNPISVGGGIAVGEGLSFCIRPLADDLATTHFFNQFTSQGHWEFLRVFERNAKMDPCLDLAIRACGMAALTNVEHVEQGRDYARSMYVEALGLLNAALRDPVRSKTDEALIAVAMMGYYENLVCDSRESIASWKAHIHGATQLLKLRGPEQFRTPIGRMLFRETRAQIMITCIWDDLEPPDFLGAWQDELQIQSPEHHLAKPADDLTTICFDFARIRARIEKRTISDSDALAACNDVDRRMLQWSLDTMASGDRWRYTELDVPDSPHVWNGLVHSYAGHPAPSVWNTFRSIRILVTRSQEWLCKKFPFSPSERSEQTAYFRKVRRQMTDEICAGIPCSLGHAAPAFNSPSILISAYASIWPLFFAGTCALERLGTTSWDSFSHPQDILSSSTSSHSTSAASAQAAWLMGRLDYISNAVGLKWAGGIAAALKGDFTLHTDLLPSDLEKSIEEGAEVAPAWVRRIQLSVVEKEEEEKKEKEKEGKGVQRGDYELPLMPGGRMGREGIWGHDPSKAFWK